MKSLAKSGIQTANLLVIGRLTPPPELQSPPGSTWMHVDDLTWGSRDDGVLFLFVCLLSLLQKERYQIFILSDLVQIISAVTKHVSHLK